MNRVTITERHYRVYSFQLFYADVYYHIRNTRIWKAKSTLTDDEHENDVTTDLRAEAIMASIIASMFAEQNATHALVETSNEGPELVVTIDVNACPFAAENVDAAFKALHKWLNKDKKPLTSDEPQMSFGRWKYAPFDVPDAITKLLGTRRKRKSKT